MTSDDHLASSDWQRAADEASARIERYCGGDFAPLRAEAKKELRFYTAMANLEREVEDQARRST